jgi:hypothetical protein
VNQQPSAWLVCQGAVSLLVFFFLFVSLSVCPFSKEQKLNAKNCRVSSEYSWTVQDPPRVLVVEVLTVIAFACLQVYNKKV